jgi:hypothetical protein
MKVNEILPGKLYQRGRFLTIGKEDKLATLAEHGIDVVVNLSGDPDPHLCGIFCYMCYQVSDGQGVPPYYHEIADVLTEFIWQGHGVLTHCRAGRNRSGLLNALIVRRYLNVTGAKALEIVREGRPRSCGSNPFFEEYLDLLPLPDDYIGG